MPLLALRERIYLAKRAAHVARVADHGMTRETAERAVEAWEMEAATRGLARDAPTFWADAEVWILARRWSGAVPELIGDEIEWVASPT